jgi:transposase
MTIHPDVIGIDVSKAFLDIFDVERGRPERFPNDAEAVHALARRLRERPHGYAVFEATAPYDKHLREVFTVQGIAFARVNPQLARHFAKAKGRKAKTDAIDARATRVQLDADSCSHLLKTINFSAFHRCR